MNIEDGSKSGKGRAPLRAQRALVRTMARFGAAYSKWIRANLKEVEGITPPRLTVLAALFGKGPQIMAELADRLDVSARNVTVLVDGMERDGFLRREAHPTDRRATVITLTKKGQDLAESILGAHEAAVGRLFTALDAGTAAELQQTLDRLLAWLDHHAGA